MPDMSWCTQSVLLSFHRIQFFYHFCLVSWSHSKYNSSIYFTNPIRHNQCLTPPYIQFTLRMKCEDETFCFLFFYFVLFVFINRTGHPPISIGDNQIEWWVIMVPLWHPILLPTVFTTVSRQIQISFSSNSRMSFTSGFP